MPFSQFTDDEILTFFAILVRYSVMGAVIPFIGDKVVPAPVKVLLSLCVAWIMYPTLVQKGWVHPHQAQAWGNTAFGIAGTIALEALVGLILGFTAKVAFDTISFGANLIGSFMGFAAASTFDPHQESNTQVIAEVQMAIAMLIFLTLNGHHLMLRAAFDSYKILGLGEFGISKSFLDGWIHLTAQVVRFGVQIAAPVALSVFAVNVIFGIMAKSVPQLNILVLSMSVTSIIGLCVLFLSIPQFATVAGNVLEKMGDQMNVMLVAMGGS